MTMQNGTAGFDPPPDNSAVNGTGPLVPEADAAAAPEAASPQPQEELPTIESLQAQLATLTQQAEKRENDMRSLEGRLRSSQKGNTQLDELTDSVATVVDTLKSFIRFQGTQDSEQYVEDLQRVEANATNRRETSNFQRASQGMIAEISQAVDDVGISLEDAPELQQFREIWGPAYDAKDLGGIYQAHAEFNRAMRKIDRDRFHNLEAEAEKERAEAVRKFAEENGLNTLDMDATASSPVSMNTQNILSRLGDTNTTVSREEIGQAQELLRKQGIRI